MAKCVKLCSWVILMCAFVAGVCGALSSWNMHDLCNAEISTHELAGEVSFDAEHLSYYENEDGCTLTITPDTVNDYDTNMVLFYFMRFELQSLCSIMNVTVRDGRHSSDRLVKGLPQYLCENNATLTEQILSTSGRSLYIQVNVRRTSLLERRVSGTFVLRFITYHTGSCYDSNVHECSNGNCIPLVFNCSENIKTCGEVDSECTEKNEEQMSGGWFGNIFRYILIMAAFIFIIIVLNSMFKNCRNKCREAPDCSQNCFRDCFGDCCRDLRIKCRNCKTSINSSRFPKPRLPHCIRNLVRSNNQEMTDASTNVREETSEAVENPAFSGSYDHIDQITVHSPPPFTQAPQEMTSQIIEPPSYEEVMVSNPHSFSSLNINEQAPSYEEIMTPDIVAPPPFLAFENISRSEDNTGTNTNEVSVSHVNTTSESNERIMASNQMIQSSLETDSPFILNEYLSQFGVELSDGYSTDPDWDQDSNSSDVLSEQAIEAQTESYINVSNEEDIPVPPPAYEEAVPPPYYYDYIANVDRYRLDSVGGQ